MFAAFGFGIQEMFILLTIAFLTFFVPGVVAIVAILLIQRSERRKTRLESAAMAAHPTEHSTQMVG